MGRTFDTGAYRDSDDNKLQYARFFSPAVLRRRAEYMQKHRVQSDGEIREPDNWKKGMPIQSFMDGLARHVQDVAEIHESGATERYENGEEVDLQEALCAIMFNCEGWLYELLEISAGVEDNGQLQFDFDPPRGPKGSIHNPWMLHQDENPFRLQDGDCFRRYGEKQVLRIERRDDQDGLRVAVAVR